jgi:hypothetical protein
LIAIGMGQEDWGNGNCSGNGALGQEQQEQQEAMAMGQPERQDRSFPCCNGDGGDRSIAIALGQGHWGALGQEQQQNSVAMAMGQPERQDRLIVFYIAAQKVDNSGW